MGDIRTTLGEEPPLPRRDIQRKRRNLLIIISLIIIALLVAGSVIKVNRYTLASGYVTTQAYAEVRPPVTGIVSKILVRTGQTVKAGDVLVQLNSEEEEATLAETKARLSKLEVSLEKRKAEIDIDLERRAVELKEQKREHNDHIAIAELQLKNNQAKLEVTRELVEKGLKAKSYLEDQELATQLAQATLDSYKSKDFSIYDELLRRDREKYDRELEASQKEISATEDAVRRAEAKLRIKQVRAPIDGTVVRYEFVIGELLQPTSVIYEIFGGTPDSLKLRVNERYATKVAVGQKYRARLNSYHGLQRLYFYGNVQYMKGVIQSQGANNYRVAYCSFDTGGRDIPPGTTAEARIYYGKSCLWFYLFNIDLH